MEKNDWRIGILFLPGLTAPLSTFSDTTISGTLRLLEPLARDIFAITGNLPENAINSQKIHISSFKIKVRDSTQAPVLVRIPTFILIQLKMSYHLLRIASKIDIVFLAAGASTLFLPALLAKLLGKKLISLRPGDDSQQQLARLTYKETLFGIGRYLFPPILGVIERLNYRLSDKIIVFRSDFTTPALKRYADKVILNGSRFYADTDTFKIEKKLDDREKLVGYIGRFVEAGGVLNFVKALPLILKESAGVKVMIGGDGPLCDEIKKGIKDANLDNDVTMTGWIPHEKIPQYLNEVKLLVIPSYQEAGPHMLFEAMACGTPVVAAPAGVMPDVITDGENGFVMEDNSPECIAKNVIRALNHPNLDKIAKNARKLIEWEYTYQAAVERYRSILASLR